MLSRNKKSTKEFQLKPQNLYELTLNYDDGNDVLRTYLSEQRIPYENSNGGQNGSVCIQFFFEKIVNETYYKGYAKKTENSVNDNSEQTPVYIQASTGGNGAKVTFLNCTVLLKNITIPEAEGKVFKASVKLRL